MNKIYTEKAPAAVGPYSQAVVSFPYLKQPVQSRKMWLKHFAS